MTLKGNTVTPDKRKGTVYIQQSDDSLIHFCWKDRTTGNVDDVSDDASIQKEAQMLRTTQMTSLWRKTAASLQLRPQALLAGLALFTILVCLIQLVCPLKFHQINTFQINLLESSV